MINEIVSFSSGNIKYYHIARVGSLFMNTTISEMSDEDLEFYKRTREALDSIEKSDFKGMSKEEFLKELDSW